MTITNGESATRTNVAYGQSGEQAANAIKKALVEEAKERGLIGRVSDDDAISALRDALEENPEAKEALEKRFIELIEATPDSVFGIKVDDKNGRKYLESAMNSDSINQFFLDVSTIGLDLGLSRFVDSLSKRIEELAQLQTKALNNEVKHSNRTLEQEIEAGEKEKGRRALNRSDEESSRAKKESVSEDADEESGSEENSAPNTTPETGNEPAAEEPSKAAESPPPLESAPAQEASKPEKPASVGGPAAVSKPKVKRIK